MHQHHMSTHPPSLCNLWIPTVRLIQPQWLVHIHRCRRFPTQRHHVLVPLRVSIPVLCLSRLLYQQIDTESLDARHGGDGLALS